MTTAGQQMRDESHQVQKSLISSGNWRKTFPSKIETESKSCTFVKKLLTVALSNITYLRSMFPEDAYANRSLDGLSLKILKENNDCMEAKTVAGWLIGAFEALEKKYLRELMLVVYLDPTSPDLAHEMYTFSFSYPGGLATCQLLQGEERREVKTVQADDIYKETKSLLRTLVILTQGLSHLPSSAYLAMKLTYYDEVTPEGYEPAGFRPTELVEPQVADGTEGVNVGKVSTSHHMVRLKVKAVCQQVEQTNSQQPRVVTNGYSCSESKADLKETGGQTFVLEGQAGVHHGGDVVSVKGRDSQEVGMQSQELPSSVPQPPSCSVSLLENSQNISCICQNLHPDPLMLQCHHCGHLQHASCYRILQENQVPTEHCCVSCSLQLNIPCTDPKLVKLSTKPAVALTCVYRRVLVSLRGTDDFISQDFLCSNVGVSEETADKILVMLASECCILPSEDEVGLYSVNKTTLETITLPKYLGVKLLVPPPVESVIQQTEKMEICGSNRNKGRGESEVQWEKRLGDDGGQDVGRRSKRLKKSSRSNDYIYD